MILQSTTVELHPNRFLLIWHDMMQVLAIVSLVMSVAIYITYKVWASQITNYRKKYDFINHNEIKWYKAMFYAFSLSVGMGINTYAAGSVYVMGVWFFVRAFTSIAGATLVGYVASILLDFYHPSSLAKKLKKWRHKPRINSKTGKEMQLLAKSKEYVYLDEKHSSEQGLYSMDYDVWIDTTSGDVALERYESRAERLLCGNCGLYTMRVVNEEYVDPDQSEGDQQEEAAEPVKKDYSGELLRHYKCSYCSTVRTTQFYISAKTEEDYKNEGFNLTQDVKDVYLVKIELHSTSFGAQDHEFETLDQARKFLDEYTSQKT